MNKISFKNDYSEGAHPRILQALLDSNMDQQAGYGKDDYSLEACALIKSRLDNQESEVYLLSAGTQTNLIAIASILRPYEACISPESGHIATHEAGAIESTGHKILTICTDDGKLTPELIDPVVSLHADEHMVQPKLLYISNPTELGTVYNREELIALNAYCRKNDLLLYCDGARIGQTIVHPEIALTLADYAKYTDAFFIGGTKNGALLGEALVVNRGDWQDHMRYQLKQRGALMAKGRVLGLTFQTLFKDGLYEELALHAWQMAARLRHGLVAMGVQFLVDPSTNQQFPILSDSCIEKISVDFDFYVWAPAENGKSAVRLITSWATRKEDIDHFLAEVKNFLPCVK
jgi:threonine aldolase